MKKPLTEVQQRVMKLIEDNKNNVPTVREMQTLLGYKSTRSISDILDSLESNGYIIRTTDAGIVVITDESQRFIEIPFIGDVN